MPSEFLVNITAGVGNGLFGLPPVLSLYFFVFIFSVAIGLSLGIKTREPWAGLFGFIGALFMFAIIGAFPLWILIIPIVIVIMVRVSLKGDGG